MTLGESSAAPAAMIAVSGVRRSWDTARSSEVFNSSERRSASASIASSRIRSRSAASAAASRSARSASTRRRSDSSARARASSARVPEAIATITKTTSATMSCLALIVSLRSGGR